MAGRRGLLDLPAELRVQIYRELFLPATVCYLTGHTGIMGWLRIVSANLNIGMRATCKQVRRETETLFYSTLELRVQTFDNPRLTIPLLRPVFSRLETLTLLTTSFTRNRAFLDEVMPKLRSLKELRVLDMRWSRYRPPFDHASAIGSLQQEAFVVTMFDVMHSLQPSMNADSYVVSYSRYPLHVTYEMEVQFRNQALTRHGIVMLSYDHVLPPAPDGKASQRGAGSPNLGMDFNAVELWRLTVDDCRARHETILSMGHPDWHTDRGGLGNLPALYMSVSHSVRCLDREAQLDEAAAAARGGSK